MWALFRQQWPGDYESAAGDSDELRISKKARCVNSAAGYDFFFQKFMVMFQFGAFDLLTCENLRFRDVTL